MKRDIIYLIAFVFISACNNKPDNKKAELEKLRKERTSLDEKITKLEAETGASTPQRITDVGVETLSPSTFTSYIEIQGTVDADENLMANSQAAGVITAIFVKSGQRVGKGQVLAQLDNSALQQQILQAQTQVDVATTLFERQKNLWDQKIGTEVQFIQARSNRDIAQKQLAGLKAQASMYRIVAPVSGTVDLMDLKLGQAIQPGTQGIRIVNLSRLKIKTSVPETYASQLSRGNKVLVTVPDADESFTANLSYISKIIDPASRSFSVEVRLPERASLKPNMTAVLKIVDDVKQNAIVLPVKAIQQSEKGKYVYTVENNKAKRTDIKVGSTYSGKSYIESGLKANDKVIIEGAQNVEDGDAVRVQSM